MKDFFDMELELDLRESDNWEGFLQSIQTQFDNVIFKYGTNLFKTNMKDILNLYNIFLSHLPDDAQQTYNCRACRHFVERYGGLVVIKEDGQLESVVWNADVPDFFKEAVKAVKNVVESNGVNGVFITKDRVLGQPLTGDWSHMSLKIPDSMLTTNRLKTPTQLEAEKSEEFKMLIEAIKMYSLDVVEQAVVLLEADALYRSEKCLGVAKWFRDLLIDIEKVNNKQCFRTNLIWRAVGNAPVGFCHIRSGMIGTLLDDIASGLDITSVQKRFADKMHPLKYQRPQAAPKVGNIMQAEKIVKELGIEKSLQRRFARLDEIPTIWKPVEKEIMKNDNSSVFGHLLPKENTRKPMELPAVKMTWVKFLDTVLQNAETIEYYVTSKRENYVAVLTSLYEDAPPILQWDKEEKRNPFSSYVYNGGSVCTRWGLRPGFCKVTGICYKPSMWTENMKHFGKSVYFILDGAKDNRVSTSGNAIFPETLKNEFHEIRSTIAAFSKGEVIHGYDEASACGIVLDSNIENDIRLKVTSKTGVAHYILDRWD